MTGKTIEILNQEKMPSKIDAKNGEYFNIAKIAILKIITNKTLYYLYLIGLIYKGEFYCL